MTDDEEFDILLRSRTEAEAMMYDNLLRADLKQRRVVFYPSKLIERFLAEPYSVWLLQNDRREHDPQSYTVKVMRENRILSRLLVKNYDLAVAKFEVAKEIAIINVGCEALGIPTLPTPGLDSAPFIA